MGEMARRIEEDDDVSSALRWLGRASGDSSGFWARLECAQQAYRAITGTPGKLGPDPELPDIGGDVVGAFLAQAKSLVDDRRSYDFALASRTVPWIKQIGRNVTALDQIPGARDRAARMLRTPAVEPDGAMLELAIAGNYADEGFDVEFIEETKGTSKTPDLQLSATGLESPVPIECKRLRRGKYEADEQKRHRALFSRVAQLINERALSFHLDVTYTQELASVPETYLADRLARALSSPVITLGSYPWRDEYGFGKVRQANLHAVRDDTRDSSLYFGTKLARLLSGQVVRESGYHLVAGANPDDRDPRYIKAIHYGSVVTWQCIAPEAIEKKARYVKAKLVEADRQLTGHGPGIVHVAMDVELKCQSSDLRRARNKEAIMKFRFDSPLMALYVHYLVPRISEAHSWLIDETVDRFGHGELSVPQAMIFPGSVMLANDHPAWRQEIPLPERNSKA